MADVKAAGARAHLATSTLPIVALCVSLRQALGLRPARAYFDSRAISWLSLLCCLWGACADRGGHVRLPLEGTGGAPAPERVQSQRREGGLREREQDSPPPPPLSCARDHGGCPPSQRCIEEMGILSCAACPEGAEQDGGGGCRQQDPCAATPAPCDALTVCSADGAGARCGPCPDGYTGTGESGCVDVDECALGEHQCDPLAGCQNLPGSFRCGQCPAGYQGAGGAGCEDIDECAAEPCSAGACQNLPGAFACGLVCPSGFELNADGRCEDENECALANVPCEPSTRCENLPGGYRCAPCTTPDCAGVATCGSSPAACDLLTDCTDTPAGPQCGACPPGFGGDGVQGCQPSLLAISVESGGVQLSPAFDPGVTSYVGYSPFTASATLRLNVDHPAGTSVEIDGSPLPAVAAAVGTSRSVVSRLLSASSQPLQVSVVASQGLRRDYVLALERGTAVELIGYLKAPQSRRQAEFGAALAANDGVWLVGAPGEDSQLDPEMSLSEVGAAYVYRGSAGALSFEARLSVPPLAGAAADAARFGAAVALGADHVVVGAPGYAGEGRVFIFERGGDGYQLSAELAPPSAAAEFGHSVSLAFPTLVVGAPGLSAGAVFVYTYADGAFRPTAGPLPPTPADGAEARLGSAVATDGKWILLSGQASTHTYAVDMPPAQVDPAALSLAAHAIAFWEESVVLGFGVGAQQYLRVEDKRWTSASRPWTLSARAGSDGFGAALSIDTQTGLAIIGAPADDTVDLVPPTAVSPAIAPGVGAAYVTSAVTLERFAYLRAPNLGAFDNFGAAVAVVGYEMAVGAPGESNSSSGLLTGEALVQLPSDDLIPGSGAVYLFH